MSEEITVKMKTIEQIAEEYTEMNYGGTKESPYIKEVARLSFIRGYNMALESLSEWIDIKTPAHDETATKIIEHITKTVTND